MADSRSSLAAMGNVPAPPPAESLAAAILGSPVLWGGLAASLFYSAIPYAPMGGQALQRYFCSHPLEYALVGLFCIGLAILTRRLFALRRERAALVAGLPDLSPAEELNDRIDALEQQLQQAPQHHATWLHRRTREVTAYLRGTGASSGLESHLKHLSEAAADRLHESYSLLLTINWAVPIIGFLGTVIGITLAIANVTPEQLDTSLNSVTGGLAIAFDTTTVAMSFSLVLVFAYDAIRRLEQRVLTDVDDLALRRLLPMFAADAEQSDPLGQAQADAARTLIERTEALVQQQTRLWTDSVDGLRERWSQTLADQQQQLADGLNSGVEATLGDHAQLLQQMRQEFCTAFEQATEHFTTALQQDREFREQQQADSAQSFDQIWSQVRDDLQQVVRSHDAHTEDLVDRLSEKLDRWQTGLQHSTQTVEAQLQQLQQVAETLLKLADQEQHLVRVQHQLSENLEAVQAAETFEQTLHNLTAAVHLLTARAKPRAAA
jgi:biopolymer transport protein ExbB/TolQ